MGLTNYFRKFIENYISKASPLQNLLWKSSEFVFEEKCVQSFELLKKELTSSPVLYLYNPSFETEVHTDASALAVAAILLQKQSSGQWDITASLLTRLRLITVLSWKC